MGTHRTALLHLCPVTISPSGAISEEEPSTATRRIRFTECNPALVVVSSREAGWLLAVLTACTAGVVLVVPYGTGVGGGQQLLWCGLWRLFSGRQDVHVGGRGWGSKQTALILFLYYRARHTFYNPPPGYGLIFSHADSNPLAYWRQYVIHSRRKRVAITKARLEWQRDLGVTISDKEWQYRCCVAQIIS
ncbi:hypothetical protein NDU88_006726 [Pleurodeles waltl]|uniref:Uncharacterized protein n=1 Tax=Pleurodeles waltl TaxID=8319 RepID=A0AAV7WFH8_PLEWA|nr:hypothetical protein NDU88_006726 [Pleurodeles waltl]